jgi:hypothetical protein
VGGKGPASACACAWQGVQGHESRYSKILITLHVTDTFLSVAKGNAAPAVTLLGVVGTPAEHP